MMTSVNCIFLRFIYDLWHRYWQLVLIVYLQDLLYPHSMSGGYIAIWPCPSVRLSIRSHFRNIYLCFYWKKWFYIWYMALAWWLVPCLPFPGLSHIYFLFTVRLRIFHVAVMKTFITVISASTGRNDFIFDILLWHGDLYSVSPFQVYRTSTSCLPCDLQMNEWGYS
jgi:hypothetical protein